MNLHHQTGSMPAAAGIVVRRAALKWHDISLDTLLHTLGAVAPDAEDADLLIFSLSELPPAATPSDTPHARLKALGLLHRDDFFAVGAFNADLDAPQSSIPHQSPVAANSGRGDDLSSTLAA